MTLSRKGLFCCNVISRLSSLTAAHNSSYLAFQRYYRQENALHNSLPSISSISNVNLNNSKTLDLFKNKNYGNVSASLYTAKTAASSSQIEQEYKCPSRLMQHFSQLVILDTSTSLTTFYDCPVSTLFRDFLEAPTVKKDKVMDIPGISSPAKEAKLIMKIRHKKMKKHKLKKLRKRMYFLWSRQKKARKAKRMAKYYKELEEIKKSGDDFNAESFVKEQLSKARKGGFYINIFESNF